MTHDPTFWILARASGLTAYVLLTCSVLVGLVLKSRPFGAAIRPAAVTDVHRALASAGLAALVLHGTALVLDATVHVSPLALVIPGLVSYRPVWTALGVVAADLMLAVIVSFPLRRRIGVRMWRRLHWFTYVVFAAATAHGLVAGSDGGRPWAAGLYAAAVGAVALASAWRFAAPPRPVRARSRA